MPGCGHCGERLDIIGNQVGRRDTCPACGAELHACIHCRHYDLSAVKECKEPLAEVPPDKESANFCELFQIGDGGTFAKTEHDAQIAAAEALFKKR